jgi:photosystem II stability/assembly factor-like uncharacterized protein
MGDFQGGSGGGTYMGSGVLKSTDGGQTWTRINNATLPQPGWASKILVDPNDSNRVYLALYRTLDTSTANVLPFGGVYISTDGGVNWTNRLPGLPRDLALDPTATSPQQRVLYAAMRGIGTSGTGGIGGVYKSSNGGQTWTPVYNSTYPAGLTVGGLRDIRVALSPANPQKIYVYSGKTAGATPSEIRLAVSNDGGLTFPIDNVLTTVDKGQFGYNTYLEVDPVDANRVYIGARDVYRSTDGGSSWTNLTRTFDDLNNFVYNPRQGKAHPDQHCLAFSPNNPNTIFIGNDGGLYVSTDNGGTFQSLNQTLSLTQFVSIARHPTNPAITYGGTQDNGTQKRQGAASAEWVDFASGDGGMLVINPLDPSVVIASYVGGTIWRFTNNASSSSRTTIATEDTFADAGSGPDRVAFYPPIVGNGVDARLYVGSHRLWINPNMASGASWSAPGGTTDLTKGGSDVLSTIGVARSNPQVIYTGSAQGQVMRTMDGGANWTTIMTGLPNRFIKSIKVDPANPAIAFLTVSGFGSGHVFKTVNSGQTWTDISGNLPNVPVNALIIDPKDANTLYAGTDIGVFRSSVNGQTWESFNSGMPPVVVTEFSADAGGIIQAATYGRGAFELSGAPCSYSLSPTSQSFPNTGGDGSIAVTAGVGCSWTASHNAPWILLFSVGQDGPGNGQINYSVLPNNTNSARSATITIGGQSFTVNQAAGNVIDDAETFITWHYRDFLNRDPDPGGLGYWSSQITQCGTDQACIHRRRIDVSAAFFIELEFQQTGSFVYRLYSGSLNRRPTYQEFTQDRSKVIVGAGLEQSKAALTDEWVQRTEFVQKYQAQTTAESFVDALIQTINQASGVNLSNQRSTLIAKYQSGSSINQSRSLTLREAIEDAAFKESVYNPSFVLMQYFGYLHRDPEEGGYLFWLDVLNNRERGNFRGMVCAFLTSAEYQRRFGQAVTRSNQQCSQ